MEYGAILPLGFTVPRSSFHIRKDLTTTNPFGDVVIAPGDRVVDCGGHVGTFTAAALESGAGIVHCYEAEPHNCQVLVANLARYGDRAIVHYGAIAPAGCAPTVTLMLSGFTGAHSTVKVPKLRHRRIVVPAFDVRAQLAAIQPQVLKVDIESAEYDVFDSLQIGDLASVRSLFVELHPIDDREARIARVRDYIRGEGFTELNTRPRRYTAIRRS